MHVCQRDYGGGLPLKTMAALCEDGTYGLDCGRKTERVSVLHVKLTESAFKALENYQNCKVSAGEVVKQLCFIWRE